VFGASRFLGSGLAKTARERLLTRVSGVTMLGLGVYLAAAKSDA
jgi:threonine/homoserine/homoserine lactone efflux protein